jgi:hypothetical protein
MVQYHNPEASVGIENQPYTLSIPVRGANAISIGFLANGFPDSENFLKQLESAMQALEPGIEVHAYNKGNASIPANDEMLAEMQSDCQAVVAAYGH